MGNIPDIGALFDFGYDRNQELDFGKLNRKDKEKQLTRQDLPQLLSQIPLFSNLSSFDIDQLILCFRRRTYKHDEIVIKQGSIGTEFYLIWKGSVDVIINGNKVATLTAGDTFGETALLTGNRRNATIKAFIPNNAPHKQIELWAIDKPSFIAITNRNKKEHGDNINNNNNSNPKNNNNNNNCNNNNNNNNNNKIGINNDRNNVHRNGNYNVGGSGSKAGGNGIKAGPNRNININGNLMDTAGNLNNNNHNHYHGIAQEYKQEEIDGNGEIDDSLSNLLVEYNLDKFSNALSNQLGVETVNDLKYLDRNDFAQIGCKIVHMKKFEEIVAKHAKGNNKA